MNDWGDNLSRRSRGSTKSISRASPSSKQEHRRSVVQDQNQDEEEKEPAQSRISRSDPDRDQESNRDERRTNGSLYSEDSETLTERSLSPYSCSRTPSPTPQRRMHAKRVSGSPIYKTAGLGRRPLRPGGLPLSYLRGQRSQSKESSPSKDLDLVTKRMLSVRLLKINELRNSLAELQLRTDELQKENRILRQLKIRQEKALQRYDDTESEISKLLSQHASETHALRERLRRTKEKERAAERRLKESEEQLQRSRSTIARLKKLVEQNELGARDELSRKLEEEKTRAQEMANRVKELERSLELSSNSFLRQLAAERKKTVSVQEEMKTLQGDLDQLTNKLREKERELDTRNIYANRMVKSSQRKDADSKQKISSRSSSKAIQTQDRLSSPDFPSPPPGLREANEHIPDEYLSLKEQVTEDGRQTSEVQKMKGKEKDSGSEKKKESDTKTKRSGAEAVKEDTDGRRPFNLTEDKTIKRPGHVQGEVERWNQQASEEDRGKKEQLLAKMREIDCENHDVQRFTESTAVSKTDRSAEGSIFNLTEPELGSRGRRRPALETTGRRATRSQMSGEDLAFGGYAPSFSQTASRGSPGFPSPPPREERDSALEAIGVFTLRGADTPPGKETDRGVDQQRKSNLMQQLFGAVATISSPAASNGLGPDSLISFHPSSPPALNTLRVRESRPAVRAIASFDDDIEEITL